MVPTEDAPEAKEKLPEIVQTPLSPNTQKTPLLEKKLQNNINLTGENNTN